MSLGKSFEAFPRDWGYLPIPESDTMNREDVPRPLGYGMTITYSRLTHILNREQIGFTSPVQLVSNGRIKDEAPTLIHPLLCRPGFVFFSLKKMGRLVIAHHKSYHPYRADNVERVRADEEEARVKEAKEEGRLRLAVGVSSKFSIAILNL
jgi:hypothetical protein